MDCLFCALIKGDIPSKKVWDDEMCYAFLDINPQAPIHCLVVPKAHIASAKLTHSQGVALTPQAFVKA